MADDVKFDLRAFREDILQLSQLELANLLGVRQDNVSRMEKKPEQIAYPVIVKLAKLSGLTLDQVIGYERPAPKALAMKPVWNVKYHISALQKQADDLAAAYEQFSFAGQQLSRMVCLIKSVQKPRIGIAGEFASGKSTLMNNLLGREIVPVNASFLIPFRIHVKHLEDRPGYMKDDVYIIRRNGSDEIWDGGKLEDEVYCRDWILDEGGFDKIFSCSAGISSEYDLSEIGFALVFYESEILRNCDIVRLPSQDVEPSPGQRSFGRAETPLDILIYLLSANRPLGSMEIQHFTAMLRQLRIIERAGRSDIAGLSNLFVAASKAHLMGTLEEAQKAVGILGSRLYDAIPPSFWKERQAVSSLAYCPEDFYARIFPYAVDGPEWRAGFEKELCGTLRSMSELAGEETFDAVRAYQDMVCRELSAEIRHDRKIMNDRKEYQRYVKRLMETESVRWANNAQKRDGIIDASQRHKKNARDEWKLLYEKILSEQNVARYLPDDTGRYGPAQMQKLASFLNSELETALHSLLEKEVSLFCIELDEYLAGCEAGITDSGFSVYGEFAYGLQGKVSIGAIVQWLASRDTVETAASLPPLGTEKIFKSAVGLDFGCSVAGADSVLFALEDARTVSGKKVYAQILKVYSGEDVPGKYYLYIDLFWENVLAVFLDMSEKLENAWEKHLGALDDEMQKDDADLMKQAEEAQKLKHFFQTISLRIGENQNSRYSLSIPGRFQR